jgi:uncharacterized surface protein with fasciclin (FAS1) repeats
MKKKKLLPRILWALLILPVVLISCEKEESSSPETETPALNIVEIAQQTEDLSSLVAALTKADTDETSNLIETLSGEGPFTVFAPTDEAFGALLAQLDGFENLDDFDTEAERDLLRAILTYHVVAGVAAESTDLSDGQQLTTVQGEDLRVSLESGVAIEDATETPAMVILPDVVANNGVVHIVDKVLLPQAILDALAGEGSGEESPSGTLVDLVVETEALSVLEAAVVKAGLVETLNGEGPFTVFAPTDDAFVALLNALGDDYNSLDDFDTEGEIALLTDILLYHVAPGDIRAADLAEGTVPTALEGNALTVIASGDTFVIGDATDNPAGITGTDFLASNGVAHTIDKVLLPPSAVAFLASLQLKTIVEIAVETDDLSLLVDALTAANAGLVETLNGDGPFTVFAPTNQAFVDLLAVMGDNYNSLADFDTPEERTLLVDILTYHVVTGIAAFSSDLSNGQQIGTVQGESVGVDLSTGVRITDATGTPATVVLPDVEASNGVVHVIDKVLLPSPAVEFLASLQLKNIVEIAVETDDLSLLVAALGQANAGLVETLSGEGPFTVLAPTNQAFANLLDALGPEYHSLADFDTEAERGLLVEILTYHVVAGTAAFSNDLNDGQTIPTVQGESIGISLSHGVQITDATQTAANVVLPDVEASNGVVHVIDKVLLPQAVLDALNPPMPNIVELAQSVPDLSLLVEALIQADAGLVEVLSGEGPFTVFAPTNEAFADLLAALGNNFHSLADFDTPEEKELLAKVLTYHVVAGAAVFSTDLSDHQELHTVQGESLFAILSHGVAIRDKTGVDANVVGADNQASNGVVHVIDKVLLPQEVLDILNPPGH